ncbi:MAG: LysR family transcriptional regulator [Piscirickettsiaceae bacterium]|nr:LysR family transcriptional regulator [Piscirickettsiaceae bacterium]
MITNLYRCNFDLRQLRTFLTIAQTLSFRKAADQLHIAQPALSRQISQLESALNCQLFDRKKRQIKLTAAGDYLFDCLPSIFENLNLIADRTTAIANGKVNKLKFGFSSAAMSNFLPAIIKELHQKLPDCEFEFVEKTSEKLIQAVISETLDAAFILQRPQNPLLNTIPIKAGHMGLILPENHQLAGKICLKFEDLRDETLILFPRMTNPTMYDDIISYCHQAGFSPKAIIETAPRSTAIGLVAAGQGIATIAESLKHTCITGTIYRPLRQPAPMINYSCITRTEISGHWIKILKNFIQTTLA